LNDVRVLQQAHDLGFTLEPHQGLWITGEMAGQHLDGDLSMQPDLLCFEYDPHSTAVEDTRDVVRAAQNRAD
jgi:hypothetical protein